MLKDSIITLAQDELQIFDQSIIPRLEANIPFIEELSQHIIKSGGKRLRPLLVILGCKLFGQKGEKAVNLAIAIEYFHTATLLHDDVVDNSSLRRGRQAAHLIWGSKASVLMGDFLFTRAFQLLVETNHAGIIRLLADTSNIMSRGEILQLVQVNCPSFDYEQYKAIIYSKTATLFSAAAQMGALLTEQKLDMVTSMANYGLHLGNAFQLVDDALDYSSTAEKIGKNIGDDLASGKMTLPIIYAYHHSPPKEQALIKQAIEQKDLASLPNIKLAIEETKAIEYTYDLAKKEVGMAQAMLKTIPASAILDALSDLAEFAVSRLS